jgi:hypothetical protein
MNARDEMNKRIRSLSGEEEKRRRRRLFDL